MQRAAPNCLRANATVSFNTTGLHGDHTHTTRRYILKPFTSEILFQSPSEVAHAAPTRSQRTRMIRAPGLRFTRQFILAPRFSTSSLLGLRAGRYRSSAGTRPSDRSDPSDGRRRRWRLRDALRGMG